MNARKFYSFLALAAVVIALSSFDDPAPVKFQVDTKASTLVWTASKITGSHTGTVPVKAGEIITDGKSIKQGSFELDLASLTVTDVTDPSGNAKLVGHLKNEDFFNTSVHPKASFVITSAVPKAGEEYTVKGKLTIKGASAKIKVNRTHFDIRYRSSSFFENLGDKAINDEFELDLKLVANS